MSEFQRGEKRKLSDLTSATRLQVQVTQDLAGADLSVFGLNDERRLADDRYFVFYNQLRSLQGEVSLSPTPQGATFTLDLGALPATVTRLMFVATHDEKPFSALGGLTWALGDAPPAGGGERATVRLTGRDFTNERAVMIAEIYKHGGEWRVANVGQGFAGGLQALLEYFGGEVAAPAPTPAAPPPAPPSPPSSAPHARDDRTTRPSYTVQEWLSKTAEADRPGDVFELESSKMLEVKVRARIWSKLGAMVAYKGNLSFTREGMLEGGVMKALVRAVTREMSPLAKIEGQGVCYLADQEKEISIIRLDGNALNVNGNDLLAFEDSVQHQITMHRRVASMLSGGLFSVRLQGQGMVAILSHGHPLTLRVTPNEPISTDPNATVAWSENLQPQLRADLSLRTIFGRGGGETFQMVFQGDGFVVVQPYEENVGGHSGHSPGRSSDSSLDLGDLFS